MRNGTAKTYYLGTPELVQIARRATGRDRSDVVRKIIRRYAEVVDQALPPLSEKTWTGLLVAVEGTAFDSPADLVADLRTSLFDRDRELYDKARRWPFSTALAVVDEIERRRRPKTLTF